MGEAGLEPEGRAEGPGGGVWGAGGASPAEALTPPALVVLAAVDLGSKVDLGVVLADPGCLEAVVKEEVLTNRNSVLFWVR